MLNAIIIEDERPAMDLLVQTLADTDENIHVDALLSSVKDAKQYLSSDPRADIIFSDVQLGDGYSFDIFKNSGNRIPVIFITGYDEFIMNAFSCNGIDFLLKPATKRDIMNALYKYRMFEQHFASHNNKLDGFINQLENRKKTRLIVRKGLEHLSLKLDDVVLLYTENKLVFVIDKSGKKYLAEKNLGEMEMELDETVFFRANRQFLVNVNFIKGFRTFEKVKLIIDLALPEIRREIIVSQENAPQFRQWMYDA